MTSPLSRDQQQLVRDTIDYIEEELEALPPFSSALNAAGARARDERRAGVVALAERLRQKFPHGLINDRPDWEASRVKLWGIQSTCTAGFTGALRNWCVAARKRLPS